MKKGNKAKKNKPMKRKAPPDFEKAKKKLGKKAKKGTYGNETVTEFKVRNIILPEQSIVRDKGTLLNKRNLSFDDLMAQLSHYNAHIRKDALFGLKDLFTLHPQLLNSQLASLFDRMLDRVSDSDEAVRHGLHTLCTFLFPLISPRMMAPFVPLFVVYISNGMTNINMDIRVSSLKLIELFVAHFPAYVPSFTFEVLPHYVEIISSSLQLGSKGVGTHTASRGTTPKQRIPIFKSLDRFLASALSSEAAEETHHAQLDDGLAVYQYEWDQEKKTRLVIVKMDGSQKRQSASIFSSEQEQARAKESQQQAQQQQQQPQQQQKQQQAQHSLSSGQPLSGIFQRFTQRILPILLDSWLECGPTDPVKSEDAIKCMSLVVSIIWRLIKHLHTQQQQQQQQQQQHKKSVNILSPALLKDLLRYLVPHFPFVVPATDKKTTEITFDALNIALCDILSFFIQPCVLAAEKKVSMQDEGETEGEVEDTEWIRTIFRYLLELLSTKSALAQQNIAVVLHVLQELLLVLPSSDIDTTMATFSSFFNALHFKSAAMRDCIDWMASLAMPGGHTQLHLLHGGELMNEKNHSALAEGIRWTAPPEMVKQWLLTLPKVLWKLKAQNIESTQAILSFLTRYARWGQRQGYLSVNELQDHMVPFFFTLVAPSKARPQGAKLFGPFISLPLHLQRHSLELLYFFDKLSTKMQKALVACSKHLSVEGLTYLFEMLQHLLAKESISLGEHGSLLLSILVACSSAADNNNNNNNNKEDKGKEKEKEKETTVDTFQGHRPADVTSMVANSLRQWPVERPLELLADSFLAFLNSDQPEIAMQAIGFLNQSALRGMEFSDSLLEAMPGHLLAHQLRALANHKRSATPLAEFMKNGWGVGADIVRKYQALLLRIIEGITQHLSSKTPTVDAAKWLEAMVLLMNVLKTDAWRSILQDTSVSKEPIMSLFKRLQEVHDKQKNDAVMGANKEHLTHLRMELGVLYGRLDM